MKLPVTVFLSTTWLSTALVLAAYPVPPEYAAVMLWLPAVNPVTRHVAVLPLTATAEQTVSVPFLNVTVPTPLGDGLIVAVNVTESP